MNTNLSVNRLSLAVSVAITLSCSAALGISPTNGLSLYYSFDEDEGSSVTDEAGSNDGIVYGDSVWICDGASFGAYHFDGTGDYIRTTSSSGISGSSNRTAACWFRFDGAAGVLFGQAYYCTGGFDAILRPYPSQSWFDTGCHTQSLAVVTNLNDGAWHHFAVVLDGSTTSNLTYYLDGQVWSAGSADGSSINTYNTHMYIAHDILGSYDMWTGDIDEFVIYNRALSSNEVAELYASAAPEGDTDADGMPDWWENCHGLNPYSGLDSSLKAWWTFDEGEGGVAYDMTGNGYDAYNYLGIVSNMDRYVTGKLGYAWEFDGTADFAFADQTGNRIVDGDTFTLSAWVWLDSGASAQYLTALSDMTPYTYNGYWLGFDTDFNPDQIELFWADNPAYGMVGSTNQALYVDQWAHVFATCDGTNKVFYLNGEETESASSPTYANSSNAYVLLGDDPENNYWQGKLDDVRVYTNALNSTAVADIYDAFDDPDEDGYTNLEEYQLGTDPFDPDTDGDGLPDYIDAYPTTPDQSAPVFTISYPTNSMVIP